jgi:FK506-binding protein 2
LDIVFETELMGIDGVEAPKVVVEKTSTATEEASGAAASIVSAATEAVKTALADTDSGGEQEHNEL